MKHVVVIGGGVVGASCAYALHKSGWRVTIVDKGEFGKGCSHANCGFVCPSHVLPLAEPGVVWMGIKSLFQKNSPLKIRMRFDPALWGWMFRFARRCNETDMLESGRACQALLESSRQLYDQWVVEAGLECEWQTRGLLFAFQSAEEMEKYAHTDKIMAEHFSLPAVRYDSKALEKLEPALKPGLAGAWHYEHDAHLRPDKLMTSWRRVLSTGGTTIRDNCEMQGFKKDGAKAVAMLTTQGEIAGDAFVVAAGALTPLLKTHLGCKIPIQPGKGYSITMPRPARCPAIPMIFPETRVAVTPMESGYRLGSTMEFAGYNANIDRGRLQILRDGARPFLHEPYCEPVQEEWCGWRPMTYDGKPIIGPSPIMNNVTIAAGHNMLGLSMATGTGKLVAELVNGDKPHIDPAPYSPMRF
ncbi:MAG TPA: FAD-dependent oxidoreductase [Gemmataceae bacterium]|nr:FAD-dependent oxidoreductase [Gemmataceae bacterium]